jgi:hypothetical protein
LLISSLPENEAVRRQHFFTRFYFQLVDSPVAIDLLARARRDKAPPLPITWLHHLEVVNAFELQVFGSRQKNQSRVNAGHAASAQASFREDVSRSNFLISAALSEEPLRSRFEDLSLRHTARHGFRVYDIIHVASALLLGCDTFWSFDTKASPLAKLEGLRTI